MNHMVYPWFIYLCKLVTRLSSYSSKLKLDVVRADANAVGMLPGDMQANQLMI